MAKVDRQTRRTRAKNDPQVDNRPEIQAETGLDQNSTLDPPPPQPQMAPTTEAPRQWPRRPPGRPPNTPLNMPRASGPSIWERIAAVPDADWGTRVYLYLYLLEPVCDLTRSRNKKYLNRYEGPITDEQTIMVEYGSGRYRLTLSNRKPTDQEAPIADEEFEILNPKYPPKTPQTVWLDDPRNKKWAALLPPATPTTPVAQASADPMASFDTFLKIEERMATRYENAQPQPAAPAAPGVDPLTVAVSIAEKFLQMRADNPMLAIMSTQLDEARKRSDDLMLRLMEANKPKPSENGMGSFREVLKALREEIMPAVKDLLPGAGEALATVQRSRMGGWQEFALGMAPHVRDIVGPMLTNLMMPGPSAKNGAPQIAGAQLNANPAAPPRDLTQFLGGITPALLRWLKDGMTGAEFAEWVYDGYGDDWNGVKWLVMRKTIGAVNLVNMYRQSPFWTQIQPMEAQFVAFIDSFMAWNPPPETPEPQGATDDVIDLTADPEDVKNA